MALINCKECGKEISDSAVRCPHCGCKTIHGEGQTVAKTQLVILIVNVVMIIIGAILFLPNISNFIEGLQSTSFLRAIQRGNDDARRIVFHTIIGAGLFVGGLCGVISLNKQLKKEELEKKAALITEPLPGEEIIFLDQIPESKQELGTCHKCGKEAIVAVCRVKDLPHDYKLCRPCINKYGAKLK